MKGSIGICVGLLFIVMNSGLHAADTDDPGQKINPIRCGVIVSGAGSGAAWENMTPVRSIRVDGPGTGRRSISTSLRTSAFGTFFSFLIRK